MDKFYSLYFVFYLLHHQCPLTMEVLRNSHDLHNLCRWMDNLCQPACLGFGYSSEDTQNNQCATPTLFLYSWRVLLNLDHQNKFVLPFPFCASQNNGIILGQRHFQWLPATMWISIVSPHPELTSLFFRLASSNCKIFYWIPGIVQVLTAETTGLSSQAP